MPGRPHLLDEVKQAEICALVSTGVSLRSAARYVGCDRGTIRREQLRNQDFAAQLRQAEMRAEYSPLEAMHLAVHRHWRAAAWLLERTRPQQYAASHVKDAAKLEIARNIAERLQRFVAAELAQLPDGESICRRLASDIEQTCRELTSGAACARKPKRRRQAIAATPLEQVTNETPELGLVCVADLPPREVNTDSQSAPRVAAR